MSSAKATSKTPSKKSAGQDEKSPKRANNVTIGTLGEVRGAEGDGSENGGYKLDQDQKYVYRDFSQIPEEDFDVDYEIDQEGLLQVRLSIRPDPKCHKGDSQLINTSYHISSFLKK